MDPRREADELERRLREAGTPERAEGQRRYLKSELEHLGCRVGDVRRAVKALPALSHHELIAMVEALWSRPVFERRLAAALLLDARAELLEPADLTVLQRLVRESKTWALVDPLSAWVLGRLLVAHPEAAAAIDDWATDEDFWVRRAALLSQLRPLVKEGAAFDRFGRYADAMLEEREFFIRKAIGWVLRSVSRERPDEVFAWLEPRARRASGVTIREAVKYLEPAQRERILERWGGTRSTSRS